LNEFKNINYNKLKSQVFKVDDSNFNETALEVFYYQYQNNLLYRKYVDLIWGREVTDFSNIPFIPIEFFKTHKLICADIDDKCSILFKSSGTTSSNRSFHYVKDIDIYKKSIELSFKKFIGNFDEFHILALLPSYLESGDSSLIFMVDYLMKLSKRNHSGFFLNNDEDLYNRLKLIEKNNEKALLIGVSYALLNFSEKYNLNLKNTIVMETGGMKGRREELIREDLHNILSKAFGLSNIYSEYGMTELLSQSYSESEGVFMSPPWKRIFVRDINDPLAYVGYGQTGAIDIVDLANLNSCSFIKTQDLGKKYADGSFEIVGRFDNSDIRGCNLLI